MRQSPSDISLVPKQQGKSNFASVASMWMSAGSSLIVTLLMPGIFVLRRLVYEYSREDFR